MYKDPALTETFIRKLAKTYQYILASDQKKLISVEQEIEFINIYFFLLQVRFDKSIQLNISVNSELQQKFIPPLSLQILVENAVKHNAITNDNPLIINIRSLSSTLIVSNNILKKPSDTESFKIGLENLKNRYQYFTDKPIRIINKEHFEVLIPIIDLNI